MLKLRLPKHKNIDEAKTFEQHDPTHPEYPDFVSGYCYRLRDDNYYASVSFVLPRNVKYGDLGFNVNLVINQWLIGGSQLRFLNKKDAENFAAKYLGRNLTTYISQNSVKAVRIDNYSDIPCYVDVTFVPGVTRTGSLLAEDRPEKISPNLFNRLKKIPHTYKENPFISQDADLNKKHTKALKNVEKIVPQIEKNLESLKKICNNIDLLVDYKKADINVIEATIARGETDKKFKDLLNSAWHYGKGDVLSIEIITDKEKAYFSLSGNSPIFTFNLDLLPNNIKDMFSEKLFIELLANTLAKIYKYKQRFGYGGNQHQHQIVNPSGYWQTFAIQENSIEFDLRGLEFNYSLFKNIEELINELNEAADNIKKAINIAADFLPKVIFTVDDFDSEEEE